MPDDDDQTPEPEPVEDPTAITIPVTEPPPAQPPRRRSREPRVFTEEDVERIRQEEKQKMYNRLSQVDELEAQVADMRKVEVERQKAEEKARKDIEKAAKKKEEEEMELRDLLNRKDEEWNVKLDEERQAREKIEVLLEKERAHASLQSYLSQRMVEEAENIMPELHYTVAGNSTEEIDASIERAKATTAAILNTVNTRMQNNRAGQRGATVSQPPVGPLEMVPTTQTLTADDLKAMSPEDYAANREALLREAGRAYRTR